MTLLYSWQPRINLGCPMAVKNFFLFSLEEWLNKYCHHDITYSFRSIPHLMAACLPFIFVFLLTTKVSSIQVISLLWQLLETTFIEKNIKDFKLIFLCMNFTQKWNGFLFASCKEKPYFFPFFDFWANKKITKKRGFISKESNFKCFF